MEDRKRTIAFVTSASLFSGGDKHLVDLIQRLDLSRVRPVILCCGTDPYTRILNGQLRLGVTVQTGLSRRNFFRTWLELRRNKPDVVVFVTGSVGAFPWYVFLAARLSGAKRTCAIYHMVTEIPTPVPRSRNWLVYFARRVFGFRVRFMLASRLEAILADHCICVSDNLRSLLVGSLHFGSEKAVTVRNGVDFRHYNARHPGAVRVRSELGLRPSDVVLVSVCRLVPLKGLDVLLRAVNSLQDDLPNLKCIIVGEGPSREGLEGVSAKMGLSSRVFFVGFKADVRPHLQAADIFVNPSSGSAVESFLLAAAEAMASGLPCIVPNAGGVPELITDGIEGLLISPGSVEELREAIKRLARDRAQRKRMGELAREKVRHHFDINRCMDSIKSILFHYPN